MSMDACATGARSRWTLKRVACGTSYVGSCDGLHGYLDGQPTSSAFGGFVAGLGVFSSRRRCWNHLQGELRYSSCGVVATGFPRLDYEDAVLMITLDHDAGTKTFRAPQLANSRLGAIRINERDCSPQVPLHSNPSGSKPYILKMSLPIVCQRQLLC